MGQTLTYEHLYKHIMSGDSEFDIREIERLSSEEKYECVHKLLDACENDKNCIGRVVRYVGTMIPYISSDKRYACISKIIRILHDSEEIYGKDVYNLLDFSIVKSLQPLELISLANMLSDYMNQEDNQRREMSMWGLIRIIPYLHSVNQKEFAHDIYLWFDDEKIRDHVLEGLTSLIYSMDQNNRYDMIFFFADILKGNESPTIKYFALELLKNVIAALPEGDRVLVADNVAPMIYFTDTQLVKKSLEFFASVISILPAADRFHYTQLIAGLINDRSVRSEVMQAIEKALPFLTTQNEKIQFMDLLKQFDSDSSAKSDEDGFEYESAYYHRDH